MNHREDTELSKACMEIYNEGKLSNAIKLGALGAATALGPTGDLDAAEPSMYKYQEDVINTNEFSSLWGKYYQTRNDPTKIRRAKEVLSNDYTIPSDAKDAIAKAAYIFNGDMGVTDDVIIDLLVKTGKVESNYTTKVQIGGGPARSYWQVEPETALSLLRDSSPLFGKKFHSTFWKLDVEDVVKRNDVEGMSKLLETNDAFAASMAAAKWIVSASSELKKYR